MTRWTAKATHHRSGANCRPLIEYKAGLVHTPFGIAVAHPYVMIFSLGGVLARWWRPSAIWMPWTIAAIVIAACAFWDSVVRGGRIDFIMIGLASYELIVGLTEERAPDASRPSSMPPIAI